MSSQLSRIERFIAKQYTRRKLCQDTKSTTSAGVPQRHVACRDGGQKESPHGRVNRTPDEVGECQNILGQHSDLELERANEGEDHGFQSDQSASGRLCGNDNVEEDAYLENG